LVVGSNPSLSGGLGIKSAILRLRPKVAISRLEMPRSELATFHVLRELGAAYAVAYKHLDVWQLRAEFWGNAPAWGEAVINDLRPELELHDALGVFPRHQKELSDLEAQVLLAL
jgi:hypothetical protein